ncbi:hypothetical protein, partial [Nitratifractor sp.]|uniref:hypothetical protein n=1 Tax=Nitratifractor sp. TaxID=2268144 RepID=UPI0025D7CDD0
MRKRVKRKIIKPFLLSGIFLIGGSVFASTFDWSATGWNDGDLSGSYTDVDGSGINITVTVTGDTDKFGDSTP